MYCQKITLETYYYNLFAYKTLQPLIMNLTTSTNYLQLYRYEKEKYIH